MRIFVFLLPFFFLFPFYSHATLGCPPNDINIWYTAYESGSYYDGFVHVIDSCSGTWRIREAADIQIERVNTLLLNSIDSRPPNGLYKVEAKCLFSEEKSECFPTGTLEHISDNPDTLFTKKLEIESLIRDRERAVRIHTWLLSALVVVPMLIVILWPWVLVKLRPLLLPRLTPLLLIALFFQIGFLILIPVIGWIDINHLVYSLTGDAFFILSTVICMEVVYLVYRFVTRNRGKVFPSHSDH